MDYLKYVLTLRKYTENLPDLHRTELTAFLPPLCVFLYHELRQRQCKEVYIDFLAKLVDYKILPHANEVDKPEYCNTKHVISLSRSTYDHFLDLISKQNWLSVLSVINQNFVFDIKSEQVTKPGIEIKPRTALQKACSALDMGLGSNMVSFVKTLKVTNRDNVVTMAVSPDNGTLLVAGRNSVIYRWRVSGQEIVIENRIPQPEIPFVPDQRVVGGTSELPYTELRGHSGTI